MDNGDENDRLDDDAPEASAASEAGHVTDPVQRAALDTIRAARSILDAAESVITRPDAQRSVAEAIQTITRVAVEAVTSFTARPTSEEPSSDGPSGDDEPNGFERITVT